jgi:hypothetical protein
MTSTPPGASKGATSPVLSPTNGGIKKPKLGLRVQIPTEAKENSTLAGAMIKEEESSELPPVSCFTGTFYPEKRNANEIAFTFRCFYAHK